MDVLQAVYRDQALKLSPQFSIPDVDQLSSGPQASGQVRFQKLDRSLLRDPFASKQKRRQRRVQAIVTAKHLPTRQNSLRFPLKMGIINTIGRMK